MYVGRFAAVARTPGGANAVLYRVSSRSFPNRHAVEISGRLAIVPRPGHEGDLQRNPYVAYNCLRIAGAWAIASNGSHTDPIAEKIAQGLPVRDAFALALAALDYEKDDYATPRIAAAVPREGDTGVHGIVRRDALVIRDVPLEAGRAQYVATYEADDVSEAQRVGFDASTAEAAAQFAIDGGDFKKFTQPVTSAAALAQATGFELATRVV